MLRQSGIDEGIEAIEDLALSLIQDGDLTVIAMEDELVQRVRSDLSGSALAHSDPMPGSGGRQSPHSSEDPGWL